MRPRKHIFFVALAMVFVVGGTATLGDEASQDPSEEIHSDEKAKTGGAVGTPDNGGSAGETGPSFDESEFGVDSEFATGDAFSEFSENDDADETVSYSRVQWSLAILLVTVLAGVLVRYPAARKFRALFMLGGLVVLGFYRGGCPCMISSLQNTILAALGVQVNWQALVWFLGLIPVTYVFGKVWCGWVCHLGALQEFLYIPKKFELFRSRRAQNVMRFIRYGLLVALLLQLVFTKVILFSVVGPFKVAFNLFSANTTGYILLAILLVSSVFIYRPFCKAVCPVGLILGWISKIPGSAILGIDSGCKGCPSCANACQMDAITRESRQSVLNSADCIACGDCMDACKLQSLSFYRKGKNRHERIVLDGKTRLPNGSNPRPGNFGV